MVASAVALSAACVVAAPARAALVTLFPLPAALENPVALAAGPDGAVWFTQYDVDRYPRPQASILGRITTAGRATVVRLPAGSEPLALADGPDAALWYAAAGPNGGRVGRVTDAAAGEFALPRGSSSARGIVTGPDGALWFTTQQRIGRLDPAGAMTFVRVPGAKYLDAIASGHDGALWFADRDDAAIRRITTAGAVRRFPLPAGVLVSALAPGADGAMWFTTQAPSRLGRITPAGRIRTYPLPQLGNAPDDIVAGPDAAMWFTTLFGIGRITPGGEITELGIPQRDGEPRMFGGLTSGPDGALWFAQRTSFLEDVDRAEIGRIDIARHADELLVTRLADRPLRGRTGRMLRVGFTATRKATGSVRLDLGRDHAITREPVRAVAGANTMTLRLPRRPGTYRLVLRLRTGPLVGFTSLGTMRSQSGSDSTLVTVTR